MTEPHAAAVGMGSNVEDRLFNLRRAVSEILSHPAFHLLALSSVYETAPAYDANQAKFYNAAAVLLTRLPPKETLAELLAIEKTLGRVRDPKRRYGPRTIDLDLLLYGNETIDAPGLKVPHPRLAERPFVLTPLAEIAPDMTVPGAGPEGGGTTVRILAEAAGSSGVERVRPSQDLFRSPA